MSWSVQIFALLGAIVGVFSSFASTRLTDRTKSMQEQVVRWEGRRLDCYSDFASSLKKYTSTSHRIAAALGLPATALPLSQDEGLRVLAAIREELLVNWERILLIGKPDTIVAAREWRHAVERLDSFTRGLASDPTEWLASERIRNEIRLLFYEAARCDMEIWL